MGGTRRRVVALTIAGSDSSGGAGIQADLKTFEYFGVFGTSALTLITAQNTLGVHAVHMLPVDLVQAQVEAVLDDLAPAALKVGATGSEEMIGGVAAILDEVPPNVGRVVDPVMVSKHGDPLLPPECVDLVRRELLRRADVLTPNVFEAEQLLGRAIEGEEDMVRAARELRDEYGAGAVVLKGGGLSGPRAVDIVADAEGETRLDEVRVDPAAAHGTGCTFSAAITARLAQGDSLRDAVHAAKVYIQRAIEAAPRLGAGHTPVLHRLS